MPPSQTQRIQELEEQVANLQTTNVGFKVADVLALIPVYEGDHNPHIWFRKVEKCLKAAPGIPDSLYVTMAAVKLSGPAEQYYAALVGSDADAAEDYEIFKQHIINHFRHPDHERVTRNKLRHLKQETLSVHQYYLQLEELWSQLPDYSEAMKVDTFMHGLNSDIAEKIEYHTVDDLKEMVKMAAKAYDRIHYSANRRFELPSNTAATDAPPAENKPRSTFNHTHSRWNPYSGHRFRTSFPPSSTPHRSGHSSDPNTQARRQPDIHRNHQAEEPAASLKCYKCQGYGHLARDCPSKPRSQHHHNLAAITTAPPSAPATNAINWNHTAGISIEPFSFEPTHHLA